MKYIYEAVVEKRHTSWPIIPIGPRSALTPAENFLDNPIFILASHPRIYHPSLMHSLTHGKQPRHPFRVIPISIPIWLLPHIPPRPLPRLSPSTLRFYHRSYRPPVSAFHPGLAPGLRLYRVTPVSIFLSFLVLLDRPSRGATIHIPTRSCPFTQTLDPSSPCLASYLSLLFRQKSGESTWREHTQSTLPGRSPPCWMLTHSIRNEAHQASFTSC
ncbi:hypothetical protein BJY52DRAFT_750735 [Lactarius psammicola]|nr:hypothetical protein BJY52DRAFT_750735 [Lactarius psammicola]